MNNINKFGESSSIQILHHWVYPIEFISMCWNIFDRIAYYINHQKGISESVANHFLNLLKNNKERLYIAYKEKGEDCYFSFLQEKAKEATIHYIENTFFKKFTVADIDIAVQKMADHYPEASKSKLHSLKSKNFFNKCIKEIVNEIRDYDMLWEGDPAIHQVIKASSKLDAIIQVFLLAFCHDDVIIESFWRHRHQNAEKHLQSSQKINKKTNQTTNKNNIHTFQLQQNPTTLGGKNTKNSTNTETVKQIKEQIAQCLKNTQVPASIAKKIQDHIWRIYKKKSSIRQKTIESILWEYHSHTVMDQIQACCEKHKIQIQRSTTDNQKPTIHKPTTKKTNTKNPKNTDNQQGIIVSETLVSVQDSPKLLTIDLLIKICQELWYVFWDKKEFTKQAEKIGIRHRQTNNELQIKKKIIDSLSKPNEERREAKWGKAVSPYQRLAISWGNRIVKQWKVILRILKHEDYEQKVQVEFTQNNKRYDQLYEQSIGLTK